MATPLNRKHQYNLWYFAAALLLLFAYQFWLGYRSVAQITYSDLLSHLEAGRIAEVTISESLIQGRFNGAQDGYDYFVTERVDPELVRTCLLYTSPSPRD